MEVKDFNKLAIFLKAYSEKDLPGSEGQNLMSSYPRPKVDEIINNTTPPRLSAVNLILFQEHEEIKIPFIKRPNYNGTHGNQISFPGGRKDKEDINLAHTAIRETNEEIGLNQSDIQILNKLTELYIPPSNFIVEPYISTLNITPIFKADEREVEEIFCVKINDFLSNELVGRKKITVMNGKYNLTVPGYQINNHFIWGATAMILSEFCTLLKKNYSE